MASDLTFIESQFPVSKLSKESYKERKANYSQTLTGLGKWWGRKPLIMVRATILGLLLPASGDPQKVREVFLKLLTMDEEGLWRRKTKQIPLKKIFTRLTAAGRAQWFGDEADPARPRLVKGVTRDERQALQRSVFEQLSYDEKLVYCDRPEQIDGPSESAWAEINAHLGTSAGSLPELVRELGERRFGHVPRVGDAFCGGGSVPFEAARIGCEAYGSDLNPVAALLTWGALNIVGGGEQVAEQVRKAQETVFAAVDEQITEWGIEHNEHDWCADAYPYCTETKCPECGWKIPLAPIWTIAGKNSSAAFLIPNTAKKGFDIEVREYIAKDQMEFARQAGTVKGSRLECPHCNTSTAISAIHGDHRGSQGNAYGLRLWQKEDLIPKAGDVFQERLYCIRWLKTWSDNRGKEQKKHQYCSPTPSDLEREEKVLSLVQERFVDWQAKGYIPSRRIEPGDKTDEPIRTRGWTHWHHMFNSRQLLLHGLILEQLDIESLKQSEIAAILLWVGICCNFNSRICRWYEPEGRGLDSFSNQAFNALYNYACRGSITLNNLFNIFRLQMPKFDAVTDIFPTDVRDPIYSDIWLTDPPYADAINYHELSEFFLAWYEKQLPGLFPEWSVDSKRALAIRGSGKDFRQGMVDAYRNLANHMPNNGLQVVMFTHQDAGVWADLTLILWAAGLRVTAAWTIATETESALKEGNYVQGTVLMVLRKQTSDDIAFLDEIVPEVEAEVERQLKSMLALDDKEDPNFTDADYQLAAYAAALRVLTQYHNIEDINVAYELSRKRTRGETNPIEKIIENAVRTASNYLVPNGLSEHLWKQFGPEEKLYLKGLEVESHGDFRSGVYQEFARGFGVRDYKFILQSGKANQTRLKTASEFKRRELGNAGFGASLVRHALYATWWAADSGEVGQSLTWLRTEVPDYWTRREALATILRYLAGLHIEHWLEDAEAARLVAGAVENDHI